MQFRNVQFTSNPHLAEMLEREEIEIENEKVRALLHIIEEMAEKMFFQARRREAI